MKRLDRCLVVRDVEGRPPFERVERGGILEPQLAQELAHEPEHDVLEGPVGAAEEAPPVRDQRLEIEIRLPLDRDAIAAAFFRPGQPPRNEGASLACRDQGSLAGGAHADSERRISGEPGEEHLRGKTERDRIEPLLRRKRIALAKLLGRQVLAGSVPRGGEPLLRRVCRDPDLPRGGKLRGRSGDSRVCRNVSLRDIAPEHGGLSLDPGGDGADHVAEGREVLDPQRLLACEAVLLADHPEDLGLLDRVDPEVRLEVEIQLEKLTLVTGLLRDDREDILTDLLLAHPGGNAELRAHGRGFKCLNAGKGLCRKHARFLHPQGPVHDLQLGVRDARHLGDPAVVARTVMDPDAVPADDARQEHGKLRAESCGESQNVVRPDRPAPAELGSAQLGVFLLVVDDRGDLARPEYLQAENVLDLRSLAVTGQPLDARQRDPGPGVAECRAQGLHLGASAACFSRCERFVRDVNHLARDRPPVEAVADFHEFEEALHLGGDMVGVYARLMVGAVGEVGAEQLGDPFHPAPVDGLLCLEDDSRGSHSRD